MEYKAYTDKGTRDHNEDDCGISSYGDAHCLVVADGLGGHGGGDVASKCAVDAVCTLFMERGFSDHFFADAFSGAQNAILEQQALTQRFSTMKTTLVVLVVDQRMDPLGPHRGQPPVYLPGQAPAAADAGPQRPSDAGPGRRDPGGGHPPSSRPEPPDAGDGRAERCAAV